MGTPRLVASALSSASLCEATRLDVAAMTVKSLEETATGRPSIFASPATLESAGVLSSSPGMSETLKVPSSTKEPASTSRSMRSRAFSLPSARRLASRSGPPIARARGRRGRLDADPEEAETRLRQEREGDGDRHLHDDGRRHVGQDVAEENPGVRGTCGARALDEQLLAECQRLPTHEAREAWDVDDADGDPHVAQAGAERRGDGHGQHESGEGLDGVHEAHEEVVELAARVARHETHRHTRERRDGHGERKSTR